MSLFGAINTAVSGLTAQSTSFGNISEDVANSQTVGFKRVDTSFTDYLTTSTATNNGICSTRLNDRFPLQDSANRLIRIESASCCGANDRSNGSEKIGAPV